MMQRYYAIYDINRRKYFIRANKLTDSPLEAKWFCSRLAASMFIERHKELQHKSILCIRII